MSTPSLASADPATRIIDLCDLAAKAQRRLAREQDAPGHVLCMAPCAICRALATTRGEAARAVEELFDALPVNESADSPATRARQQVTVLAGTDAIPSATLDAWADSWDAYAATLAGGAK